jgi:hypothetical protein
VKKILQRAIDGAAEMAEKLSASLRAPEKLHLHRISTPYPNPAMTTHILVDADKKVKNIAVVSTLNEMNITITLGREGALELQNALKEYADLVNFDSVKGN